MIEDRLRELRVEEPAPALDLDVLVDTAEAPRRRRRSILATTVAVLLTATAAVIVGGRHPSAQDPARTAPPGPLLPGLLIAIVIDPIPRR